MRKNRNRVQIAAELTNPLNREQVKPLNPLAGCIKLACVGLALTANTGMVFADQTGGNIVAGQGSINQTNPNLTVINQASHNLAIDWQTFNINKNQTVHFKQPGSTASALNNIFDQNPSQIFGSLKANGRVLLMNPNGVIFGPNSRVAVGGLVASGLRASVQDFMAGKLKLEGLPDTAGMVVNQGLLEAATGGSITLIGKSVRNEGVILASAGQVNLIAGNKVALDFDGDGLMKFAIEESVLENAHGLDDAISNSGQITAEGGEVLISAQTAKDVFTNTINNSGVIRAGRIDNQGGVIRLVGMGGPSSSVINTGTIDASGATGGQISIHADNISQSGLITADGAQGDGGTVELVSSGTTILSGASRTSAASASGNGGAVHVLGDRVGLFDQSVVDVSGELGGGIALIGGDFQGKNLAIQNATLTIIGSDTTITADAGSEGDAGKVIVWSDQLTRFHGDISATGGAQAGDGGFVEVSGKQRLEFAGVVDLSATNGNSGTLLLDPTNIEVVAASEAGVALTNVDNFADADVDNAGGGADATTNSIGADLIDASLKKGTNVELQANNDITVSSAIDGSGGVSGGGLTLRAGDDITVNASITLNDGDLSLTANDAGGTPTDVDNADISINAAITTGGGDVTLNISAGGSNAVGTYSQADVDIVTGTGNITVSADSVALTDNTGDDAFQTSGVLTLKPVAAATAMSFGGGGAGFDISAAEALDIAGGASGRILFGDATASTGLFTVIGAVNFGADIVAVHAGSFTDASTTGNTITAGDLTLNARTGSIGVNGLDGEIDVAGTTSLTLITDNNVFVKGDGATTLNTLNLTVNPTTLTEAVYSLTNFAGLTAFVVDDVGNDVEVDDVNIGAGSFSLTATAGNINQANGGSNGITATSLSLSAASGEVGGGIAIDVTDVTQLTVVAAADVEVTGSGSTLTLLDLTIDPSTAADSTYTITGFTGTTFDVADNGADIEVTDITVNSGGTDTIRLTATSGSILGVNAAGTDVDAEIVSLKAAASIGGAGDTDIDVASVTDLTLDANDDVIVSGGTTLTDLSLTIDAAGAATYDLTGFTGLVETITTDGTNIDQLVLTSASAANLSVAVDTGNIAVDSLTTATTGNINLTASSGDITIDSTTIASGSGAITVTASGSITEAANDAASEIITAGVLNLNAGGAIGATGNELDVDVDSLSATGSSVFIDNDDGNTNGVTLTSVRSAGAINIDSEDAIVATDVRGQTTVDLTAAVGDLDVGLVTAGTTATLTSTAGNIDDANVDTVVDIEASTLNLNALNGAIGSTQVLEVGVDSALNADTSTGDGNITLTSVRELPVGTINAGAGTVSLTADVGNIINAASSITAGDLSLTATASGAAIGATGAADDINVTLSGTLTATASAGAGGIFINQSGDLTLGAINAATGDIEITTDGTLTTTSGLDLTGNNISLTLGAAKLLTVTANTAITAGNNVNLTADDMSIETTTASITATAGTTTLTTTTAGTVISVEDAAAGLQISDAELDRITGPVTIGSTVHTGGINIGSAGAVTQNKNLTFLSQGAISLSTNTLTTTAGGSVTMDSSDGTLGTFNGVINVGSAIIADGAVNLTAGGGATSLINIDADVSSATGSVTLQNANQVDLADNVDLTGLGVAVSTNVTGILLSGADATTNIITSTGDANTITLAPVTATNNPNLTLNSEGDLDLNNAISIGAGSLTATVDTDGGEVNTLTVGATLTAGAITLSGTTATPDNNDLIDINVDVTTGGLLTLQNALTVDLAADVDLTGNGVAAASANNIGGIVLSGVGTNIITSNGDAALNLASVTDSANAALTVTSTGDVLLEGVVLDVAGASALLVTTDSDDGGGANTLQVSGVIDVDGLVTLGGTSTDDTIDLDADVTAAGALTLQNALTVDLAQDVDLTGAGVAANTATNNITGINLSGAGGTNIISSTGDANTITTAPISTTGAANLTLNSEGDLSIDGTINIGAGTLTATVDTDGGEVNTLTVAGAPTAGAITLSGTTTTPDNNDIIDINVDVTTGGLLTLQNALTVDLAADVDLTGNGVAAASANNIGGIVLSGVGTNIITSNGDAALNLASVTDSANAALTVTSTGDVLLEGVVLNEAGASALLVTADSNGDGTNTLLVTGTIDNDGAVTLSGGADNNETIDLDASVSAAGLLTLQNATSIDLAQDVNLTGAGVAADTATNNITGINLSGAGGTNIISSTGDGNTIAYAPVSTTGAANLTLNSEGDLDLNSAINIGAGALTATVDTDGGEVNTLTVGTTLTAGAITLSGTTATPDNNDIIDINVDVSTGGLLTLQNAATVDLAQDVDLTGAGVAADTATNNITGINLSGAGGTNIISSTGDANTIAYAPVSTTGAANLTLNSEGDLDLNSAINIGAGALTATVDTDGGEVNTLTVGTTLTAGAITLSGTTATPDNNDLIDINVDVSTAGLLTLQNALTVDLAADVDLTGNGVAAASANNIGGIVLSGVGTNIITSNGDAALNLASVTDSANAALTVTSTGDVLLEGVVLDVAGASALLVTTDSDDGGGANTLQVSGVIDVDGLVTLGGTSTDDTIDLDADVTAAGALTLQNALTVDLAQDVDLTGAGVAANTATNNITGINLSGAGGTNIISSTGDANTITTAPISTTGAANLTLNSEGDLSIDGTINIGAGTLTATVDTDGGEVNTLTVAGAPTAGAITLSGTTTTPDNNDIIDINVDVTTGGLLTLQNALTVDLAADVDLTGNGVAAASANNIGGIVLSGVGTNIITSNGDAALNLASVTDSANAALTVTSTGDVLLEGVVLNEAGASALLVTADSNGDGTNTLLVTGTIDNDGAVTLSGGADNNETIDLDASVSAAGLLTLQNATSIDLAQDVNLTGAGVAADTATNNITGINLSGAGGTNIISSTGDGNTIAYAPVSTTGAANLTLNSEGDLDLNSAINIGAGALTATVDTDGGEVNTLTVGTTLTAGAITLSGTTATPDNNDIIDINVDVSTGGLLTLQNAATVDLAQDVDLTGAGVAADTATNNITGINLSGAGGTNIISSTGDANTITTAPISTTGAANLTLNSEGDLDLNSAINIGAGALTATVDTDGGEVNTLTVGTTLTAGAITLSGTTATPDNNDLIDINVDVTTGGLLTLQNALTVDLAADVDLTGNGVAAASANNIGGIVLSGVGTNIITSNGDAALNLASVTDSANAALTVTSTGDVLLEGVVLDVAGASALLVTTDSDDGGGANTLQVSGVIDVDGLVTLGGTSTDDSIDLDADVTAAGALTLQNALTVDLAQDVDLTGAGVAANTATNNITGINLSGAGGTNIISSTGDANTITTAPISTTGAANLTLNSEGDLSIDGTINIGAGTLTATVDTDGGEVNTLTVAGAPTAGAITLSGTTTTPDNNDIIDINVDVTTGGLLTLQNALTVDLAADVDLTGNGVAAASANNIGGIVLSGVGTNIITSNGDAALNLASVTDSANAALTVTSTGDVLLEGVVLNEAGASALLVTADSNGDGTNTLLVTGTIDNDGAVTLSGGADNNETIDLDASVSAAGLLTLQNATSIDLAQDVNLTGAGVAADTATNNITGINLSGAGGTNIISSTGDGNTIAYAPVSTTGAANLTLNSEGDLDLNSAINIGAGALTATVDTDGGEVNTLTVGTTLTAGAITLSGTTATPDNNDIIDINVDVSTGGLLTLQNAATVDLAQDVDLTGAGVAADTATNNITGINLSGAGGTNIISSTGDANTITTAPISTTGAANLTLNSEGDLDLNNAISIGAGSLTATVDTDGGEVNTLTVGATLTAGAITLSGTTATPDNNDLIDINVDVTTGGLLTLQNALTVDLAADVDLTGNGVAAASANNIGGIVLSGVGTNIITSNGDAALNLASVTDSANAALTVTSTGDVLLEGVVLDVAGASALLVTTDSDDGGGANTLQVSGVIDVDGLVTLGGTSTDDSIDLDADVTAAGALTLQNALTVDLAQDVDLTGAGVAANTATNNITGINLSGAGGTNIISSTGDANTITTAPISTTGAANLTLNSEGDLSIDGTINIGAGTLTATVDTDGGEVNTLTVAGAPTAGAITLSGTTTTPDNNDIIDINVDVTTGGLLTLQNALTVDLAADVDLTGNGVAAASANNIGGIVLSGVGTNIITSNGDAALNLASVTDSANAALTVTSTGDVLLEGVVLNEAGASALLVTADSNGDGTNTLLVTGTIDNDGAVTLSGGADNNETIDLDASVSAAGLLTLQNATSIDLAQDVNLTGAGVAADTATNNITGINLSGAGGTNIISSTGDGNTIAYAPVSTTGAANLTLNSEGDLDLNSAINIGAGALTATVDTDGGEVNTLTVGTTLTAGAITLSGTTATPDNNDIIDINVDVSTGGLLTLQNAATVDLAQDVDLTGAGVAADTATNNITGINLSGAGGTNIISSTGDGNTIAYAPVSTTGAANLTLNSEGDLDLNSAINIGAGALTATVDTDGGEVNTLTVGATLTAGAITLSGTTATPDNNDIIDINVDVSTGGLLTLQNALTVDLAQDVDLTGAGVAADTATNNITGINLSGAGGTNIISSTGDGNTIAYAPVSTTGAANLTLNSEGDLDLNSAINIGAGALTATVDTDGGEVNTLTVGTTLTAGAITLSGTTATPDNNDIIDINVDVSTGGLLTLQNAATVDLAQDVDLTGAGVAADTATNNITGINLSGAGGTNIISSTGDGNTIAYAPVSTTGAANLTLNSEGDLDLNNAISIGAGSLTATVDTDGGEVNTLTVGTTLTAGAITLSGTTATPDNNDLIDINVDVSTAGLLTLQNALTVDLAADVDLTGNGVAAASANNIGGIVLSGVGTNIITSNGDAALNLASVTDSANAALTVTSTGDVLLEGVVLNDAGASALLVTADSNGGGTNTLLVTGTIDNDGAVTLSGGADNNETIDLDASVSAAGLLTLQNATSIDLAQDVNLTGAGVAADTATNNITGINLSGAGGTNIISSTGDGNTIAYAPVSTTGAANLTLNSEGDLDLNNAISIGAGSLTATVDTDGGEVNTLTVGTTLTAGAITLSGTTATPDNNDIIDINVDVTTGGLLTLQNALTVDLAANVDLTGNGVAAASANNIGGIVLSGVGTNIITSNGDAALNLASVTDSANAALTVTSTGDVLLEGVVLNDAGASALLVTADSNGGGTNTLQVTGLIDVDGAVTLSGVGTDETIDLDADVTAAGLLTLQNAASVDLAADVDLTGNGVAAASANNIGGIVLSGVGTNIITSNGDAALNLASVTDSANAALTVTSTGDVLLEGVVLNDAGASALLVTADSNGGGTNTLQVTGLIDVDGAVTLSGVGTDETIDLDADVTAAGALTLQNAATVDLAQDVDLTGAGVAADTATNNITGINLSGAGGTNIISSTGDANTIAYAPVSTTGAANLTLNSEGNLDLNNTISIGAGSLTATVDTDGGEVNILTVGTTLTAGAITLSGTGTDDTIDINVNVSTGSGALTVQNAASVLINASAPRTLKATGGNLDMNNNVTLITLDTGASLVTLESDGGDVEVANLADDGVGATGSALTITSQGNVTTGSIALDGATTDGVLNITVDDNNGNAGDTLTIGGTVSDVASATLSGGASIDDLIDINANITTTVGDLIINQASTVSGDLDASGNLTLNADTVLDGASGIHNLTSGLIFTAQGITNTVGPNNGSTNGSVVITANDVDFQGAADSIVSLNTNGGILGVDSFRVQSNNAVADIGVGVNAPGTDCAGPCDMAISSAEFDTIADGWSNVIFGSGLNQLFDGVQLTFHDPVTYDGTRSIAVSHITDPANSVIDPAPSINISGGATILTSNLNTAGSDFIVGGDVVLRVNVTIDTTGAGADGNISFGGRVSAEVGGVLESLTLTADTGNVTFLNTSEVGSVFTAGAINAGPLGALTVTSATNVDMLSSTVAATSLDITNSGKVQLGNAGGTVFAGLPITVNSNDIDITGALSGATVLTARPLATNTSIGLGTTAAGTLNLSDTDITNIGSVVLTVGDPAGIHAVDINTGVSFSALVVNGGTTTLTSDVTATSDVTFNSDVALGGAGLRTVNGGTQATFNGDVTGANGLAVTATTINIGNVGVVDRVTQGPNGASVGNVTFTGTTNLSGDVHGNNIVFAGTLNNLSDNVVESETSVISVTNVNGAQPLQLILGENTDLDIANGGTGAGQLNASAFGAFTGNLVVGGILNPGTGSALDATITRLEANTITVSGNLNTLGNVTLLTSAIDLSGGGSIQTTGEFVALTAGLGFDANADPDGNIAGPGAAAGQFNITAGTASLIAGGNITNPENIVINLGGGPLNVASSGGDQIQFGLGSNFVDGNTDLSLSNIVASANITVNNNTVVSPPVTTLTGLEEVQFIDFGLFEEELTLFGVIGNGLAMELEQCEEQEGCAPSLTEEEVDELIAGLEARIAELERRKEAGEDDGDPARMETLLNGYQNELAKFVEYKDKLQKFLEAEEESLDDFSDDDLNFDFDDFGDDSDVGSDVQFEDDAIGEDLAPADTESEELQTPEESSDLPDGEPQDDGGIDLDFDDKPAPDISAIMPNILPISMGAYEWLDTRYSGGDKLIWSGNARLPTQYRRF